MLGMQQTIVHKNYTIIMKRQLLYLSLCTSLQILGNSCNTVPSISFDARQNDTCIIIKRNGSKTSYGSIRLSIIKNSMNDTVMLWNMKIKPGQVGEIYYLKDYYNDTANICISKLKANNGQIKIAYSL